MLNIPNRLKEERKRLALNQTEFANAVGVTKTSQSNYESGSRKPDSEYLAKAATIGVDVQYVITGIRSENFPVKTDREKLLDVIREQSFEEERAELEEDKRKLREALSERSWEEERALHEEDKRKLIEAIKEQSLEEIRAELEEDKRKLREAIKEHYGKESS